VARRKARVRGEEEMKKITRREESSVWSKSDLTKKQEYKMKKSAEKKSSEGG